VIADVFNWNGPSEIVVANLFLHHFEDADLSELFQKISKRAELFIAIEPHRFRFAAPRAQLLRIYNPQAWYGAGQYFAPNPEFGAVVNYYLREAAPGDVEVDILDAAGKSLRTLHGPGKRGINRITWDLRLEPPIKDERETPAVGGFGGSPSGPEVLPGKRPAVLPDGRPAVPPDVPP